MSVLEVDPPELFYFASRLDDVAQVYVDAPLGDGALVSASMPGAESLAAFIGAVGVLEESNADLVAAMKDIAANAHACGAAFAYSDDQAANALLSCVGVLNEMV
ncbi:hypothetical protein [Schaalia suimastitidis]|uniref:hypothetical protein n=1 Tax=Schaalia suimastitidis TaxID=121163 RepID=UPI00040CBAD2|nr:hypothetical protein [Schaalia suimastitidis]